MDITTDTVFARAASRMQVAYDVLDRLQLLERWRPFGNPILVGAVAYELVVAPDIDIEIFCDEPRIEDGFTVLRACALQPGTRRARFANLLDGPDQGLYWQVRYRHASGQEWNVDMWSMRHDHPGPTSASLVEPMKRALTDETRRAILEIKEGLLLDPAVPCPSIHIYRAVLDAGVRTLDGFQAWLADNRVDGLIDWKPNSPGK